MSSSFYCYFWGVSPLSVLGCITWLETHAPSFPLLKSLSQLLRSKALPNCIQYEVHDLPWASFVPSYSHMPRTGGQRRPKGFCKDTHPGRAVDQAGPKVPFNRAKTHTGRPSPAPSQSSKTSKRRSTSRGLARWLWRPRRLLPRGHHIQKWGAALGLKLGILPSSQKNCTEGIFSF